MTAPSTQIVQSGRPPQKSLPVQVFQEMDRRDENQILAEMRGELLEDFVYSIAVDGRRVTNLSCAGVKEAIRRHGQIEILDVRTEQDDKEYRVLVRVRDLANKVDVLGAATAEKNRPFAWTLAHNKAERNAFAKLLPAKLYATLIQEWLSQYGANGVRRIVGTAKHQDNRTVPTADAPPAADKTPAWNVPITKDQATQEWLGKDLRQFPLGKDLKSVGMVNVLNDEISIVPERPIKTDSALVDGFLLRRVVEPLVSKYSLAYTVQRNSTGLLEAVLIRGSIAEPQLKELIGGARWAFEKSLEEKER